MQNFSANAKLNDHEFAINLVLKRPESRISNSVGIDSSNQPLKIRIEFRMMHLVEMLQLRRVDRNGKRIFLQIACKIVILSEISRKLPSPSFPS